MESEEQLKSWSYFWNERADEFVLLKVRGTDRSSTDGCLIYNSKDHSILLIEDDKLAQVIMARMKTAGVAVMLSSEVPSGQNELERMINEMLESDESTDAINDMIKAYTEKLKRAHNGPENEGRTL